MQKYHDEPRQYKGYLKNALVPLEDEPGVPLSFDISMGVQKGNQGLKSRLEAAIDRRQTEILTILEEFGVPVIPSGGGSDAANLNTEPVLPDATSEPGRNPFAVNLDAPEPVRCEPGRSREGQVTVFRGRLSGVPRRRRWWRDGHFTDRRRLDVRQRQ